MIVCDRCGNKIIRVHDRTKKTLTVYSHEAAYIGHHVDLCDDCLREYERLTQKAESYFMINKEKPSDIFNGVKYWGKMNKED